MDLSIFFEIISNDKLHKIIKCIVPKTIKFLILCKKINVILYENHKLFIENNPAINLQSNGKDELENWYLIEEKMINPNNKKILDLILENYNSIPIHKQDLFLKLKQHIISFENHIKNRKEDYSKHQFPKEFVKYVCGYLISQRKNKKLDKIIDWIKTNIKNNEFDISQSYIYGSIFVYGFKEISDIDIIFYLNNFNDLNKEQFNEFKNGIIKSFKVNFKKDLHITIFTNEEKNDLEQFLKQVYYYRSLNL